MVETLFGVFRQVVGRVEVSGWGANIDILSTGLECSSVGCGLAADGLSGGGRRRFGADYLAKTL